MHFWDNISHYFNAHKTTYIDSGYFNNPKPIDANVIENNNCIAIGHSLGLIKLIRHNIKFKAIIGINSFINFLGNDPVLKRNRTLEYKALLLQFKRNPQLTLERFYQNCGLYSCENAPNTSQINIDSLQSEFSLLAENCTLPNNTPTLIIASKNDLITPLELIYDNFKKLKNVQIEEVNSKKHCLGLTESSLIYNKIKVFLNEHISSTNSK